MIAQISVADNLLFLDSPAFEVSLFFLKNT